MQNAKYDDGWMDDGHVRVCTRETAYRLFKDWLPATVGRMQDDDNDHARKGRQMWAYD